MSRPWAPSVAQIAAVEFALSRPTAGLILDPGFGKTSISLAVASICIESGDITRVIVVAPFRVAQVTWPNEVEKWSDFDHLSVYDLTDWDNANRLKILKQRSIQIVTINPESLEKLLELEPWKYGFNMLIVDESTKFKDSQTKRFKAVKKHLYRFKRRIILTGTMRPNGIQDLFGQVYILDLGDSLGEYITHFRMRYMYQLPGKAYEYFPRPGIELELYKKLEPLLMRLRAKDHLQMPELFKNVIEVDFPEKHRARYVEMEKKYIAEVNGATIAAANKAVAGIKLRQFANGFVYWEEPDVEKTLATGKPQFIRHTERLHDEKVKALVQLVDEMNGRPLLVAYEFEADYQAIMAALPDAIDLGKIPPRELKGVVDKWNRGEIPVALGHPQSIGHGLNLQEACNTVCFFNAIWDLELYLQFIARVWRQGSPFASVMVHHIICKRTRDERVGEALKAKEVSQTDFDLAILTPI